MSAESPKPQGGATKGMISLRQIGTEERDHHRYDFWMVQNDRQMGVVGARRPELPAGFEEPDHQNGADRGDE